MTLKQYRENKGLSQTALANKVGLKQTTISQYENGLRIPKMTIAIKLAKVLGVSVDEIAKSFTVK